MEEAYSWSLCPLLSPSLGIRRVLEREFAVKAYRAH